MEPRFYWRASALLNSFVILLLFYVLLAICASFSFHAGLPWWLNGKESTYNAETRFQSLGEKDPLEESMATHSSILDWRIPRTKEPDGLQSIRSQRVRHDWSEWAPHIRIDGAWFTSHKNWWCLVHWLRVRALAQALACVWFQLCWLS